MRRHPYLPTYKPTYIHTFLGTTAHNQLIKNDLFILSFQADDAAVYFISNLYSKFLPEFFSKTLGGFFTILAKIMENVSIKTHEKISITSIFHLSNNFSLNN